MKKELLEKIESLYEMGKYQEIIDSISELGYSLSAQGKYEEAIEKFEYILSLEVEDEGNLEFVYSQLGWCYRLLGNSKKALEYLNKAKEEGRNDAWLNIQYGACLAGLDKYDEAIEKYEYALNLYEENKRDLEFIL